MNNNMADALIFPITGFLLTLMIGILGWAGKKYITDLQFVMNKILSKLDNIEDQIHDLKTENQLQSAYIREIETRFQSQIDRIDKRVENKRALISDNQMRLSKLEKRVDKIETLHCQKYPNDKL